MSDINVSGLSVFNNLNVGGSTTFNLPLFNNNSVVSLNYDNSLNLVGNKLSASSATASKWTISSNNIFNNNVGNVVIKTGNPQNKLEVLNGSINTATDCKFDNASLFEYAPANNPNFFGGSQITISPTEFCIQFVNDGRLTIQFNNSCTNDL